MAAVAFRRPAPFCCSDLPLVRPLFPDLLVREAPSPEASVALSEHSFPAARSTEVGLMPVAVLSSPAGALRFGAQERSAGLHQSDVLGAVPMGAAPRVGASAVVAALVGSMAPGAA